MAFYSRQTSICAVLGEWSFALAAIVLIIFFIPGRGQRSSIYSECQRSWHQDHRCAERRGYARLPNCVSKGEKMIRLLVRSRLLQQVAGRVSWLWYFKRDCWDDTLSLSSVPAVWDGGIPCGPDLWRLWMAAAALVLSGGCAWDSGSHSQYFISSAAHNLTSAHSPDKNRSRRLVLESVGCSVIVCRFMLSL